MASQLRQVGLDFLDAAPKVLRHTGRVSAPPGDVFASVSGDPASWRDWFPGVRDGAYDSPPPHGVGSVRRVSVLGAGTYQETILAWDEPTRWAFRVDATSLPLARALVEEWTLSPTGAGTQVTWTFAVDPAPAFGLGLRLRPLDLIFSRAVRNLERRLSTATR